MKNKRKGFTLVEVLVVVAIVAILVAVSIVGYNAFTKKASKSNDEGIVSQMNLALEENEKIDNKASYPSEAVKQCVEEGLNLGRLTPSTKGNVFAYDKANNRFIILNQEYQLVYTTVDGYKFNEVDPSDVFVVVSNEEELKNANQANFSAYLKETFEPKTVVTNKGIDVGQCQGIEKVEYINNGSQQTSLIYTNDFRTLVSVQGEFDTVYHYGYSAVVDVAAINGQSYHECGVVGRLTVSKGHVTVEDDGTVLCLMHKDGTTYDADNICNIALTGENVQDCKAGKHDATRIFETETGVFEFCEHCGYSLVTIELSDKNRIKQSANVLDNFGQVKELHVVPVELYFASTSVIPDGNFDLSTLSLTETDNGCEHNYQSQIIQSATCTQQGIISFTCQKCGHQYVVKTQKKSHTYGKMTVIVEPTTEKSGYGQQTCTVCGYVRTVTLPKLSEKFGDVGTGTKDDPYQVSSEKTLEEFAQYVNENGSKDVHIVLTEDITLSKKSNWVGIGTKEKPFEGSFDGKNHKIIDLTVKQNADDKLRNVGLFGFVSGGTKDTPIEIKNVNIEKANISAYSDCAGLVSRIEVTDPSQPVYVKISNVTVSGSITGKWNVAGIVGTVGAGLDDKVNPNNPLNEAKNYKVNVVIENCTNNADVTGSMSVAGILGASGPGALPERFNKGNIAGGSLKFVNCTNNGKITYEYNAAGICAHINQASSVYGVKERTFEYSNCVNNGQIVASCKEGEYTYDKSMTGAEREKLMKSYQAAYSLFLDYSDYPSNSGNEYKEIACYLNCVGEAIKPIKWIGERKVYSVNYSKNELVESTKQPTQAFIDYYNTHNQ